MLIASSKLVLCGFVLFQNHAWSFGPEEFSRSVFSDALLRS